MKVMAAMANLLSLALLFMVCLSSDMVTAQTPMPECSYCWCHNAGDCPDPKDSCPAVRNCKTAVVKDKCGCCDVCLKSIGETCRREPLEREDEKCDKGLMCAPGNDAWYCDSMKPENVKVKRCEKEGKNKCFDLVTRKSYRVDEIWIRGDFACTACMCKRSGRLSCWAIQCNAPDCKNPARAEGRCCSFCSDTDWNKVCKFNGKKFFQSEIIVLQDRKSLCKCEESEGWVCQHDNNQQQMDPLSETPQCANPLTGEVYKEGEIWSLSECAHCLCGEFQTGNCSVIRCSKPLCDDPFKIKGKCCPVCPQDYARVCHFEGVKYFHGELVVLPDRCTLCTCSYSKWQCSSSRCKFTKMIKEPLMMRPK